VSQLVVLGVAEAVRSMAMFELEHRPVVGAASNLEEASPPRSLGAFPESGGREVHQIGFISRAHQDVPMVEVPLRDSCTMDRFEQEQELREEFRRDLAAPKVRQITTLHELDGEGKRVHLTGEAWDSGDVLELAIGANLAPDHAPS
jgi:hypothetical protein